MLTISHVQVALYASLLIFLFFSGIESLLDFVDTLDLDNNPGIDNDDMDDWSEPASSFLGPTGADDDSFPLFEI